MYIWLCFRADAMPNTVDQGTNVVLDARLLRINFVCVNRVASIGDFRCSVGRTDTEVRQRLCQGSFHPRQIANLSTFGYKWVQPPVELRIGVIIASVKRRSAIEWSHYFVSSGWWLVVNG